MSAPAYTTRRDDLPIAVTYCQFNEDPEELSLVHQISVHLGTQYSLVELFVYSTIYP